MVSTSLWNEKATRLIATTPWVELQITINWLRKPNNNLRNFRIKEKYHLKIRGFNAPLRVMVLIVLRKHLRIILTHLLRICSTRSLKRSSKNNKLSIEIGSTPKIEIQNMTTKNQQGTRNYQQMAKPNPPAKKTTLTATNTKNYMKNWT